jgi:2-amino-4-hydroxy-6-hydroxymethyldihydropteridine diphosphokinase
VRTERWGPRTLDVDVLLVGDERIDDDDLQVPHPRMWERAFVLVPLADLAPDLVAERPSGTDMRPAGTL